MSKSRKTFSNEFKAKVALEAIKGYKILTDLLIKGIPGTTKFDWKLEERSTGKFTWFLIIKEDPKENQIQS